MSNPLQVLLRLNIYSITEADYNLCQTCFWNNSTPAEHAEFDNAPLLLTHAAVHELNPQQLGTFTLDVNSHFRSHLIKRFQYF